MYFLQPSLSAASRASSNVSPNPRRSSRMVSASFPRFSPSHVSSRIPFLHLFGSIETEIETEIAPNFHPPSSSIAYVLSSPEELLSSITLYNHCSPNPQSIHPRNTFLCS